MSKLPEISKRIQVRCEPLLEERAVELLEGLGVESVFVTRGHFRKRGGGGTGVSDELVVIDFFGTETLFEEVCGRMGKGAWKSYEVTILAHDVHVARGPRSGGSKAPVKAP